MSAADPQLMLVEPPPVLYHYTTAAGFLGMTRREGRALWASSVRHLNDKEEFLHALMLMQAETSSRIQRTTDGWRSIWEEVKRILNLHVEDHGAVYGTEREIFVCCFSEAGDRLSQWRAYAPRGYCAGFSTEKLVGMAKSQKFALEQIAYGPVLQRELAAASLD